MSEGGGWAYQVQQLTARLEGEICLNLSLLVLERSLTFLGERDHSAERREHRLLLLSQLLDLRVCLGLAVVDDLLGHELFVRSCQVEVLALGDLDEILSLLVLREHVESSGQKNDRHVEGILPHCQRSEGVSSHCLLYGPSSVVSDFH